MSCRLSAFVAFCLLSVTGLAARHSTFESEAINVALVSNRVGHAVFSPLSFETDCAVVADTLGTLDKAKVVERMGVLEGLSAVYRPILEEFRNDRTNGIELLMARGFCVPEPHRVNPVIRQRLYADFGVSVCGVSPAKGANRWFQSELDGEMENFSIPSASHGSRRYCFCDLVMLRIATQRPFPDEGDSRRRFNRADGTSVALDFISGQQDVTMYDHDGVLLVRLPLAGSASLYLFMPSQGTDIAALDARMSPTMLLEQCFALDSLVLKGVERGPMTVTMPCIEQESTTDLLPLANFFCVPVAGTGVWPSERQPFAFSQRMKFVLQPHSRGVESEDRELRLPSLRTLTFDRPFVYLVRHADTKTFLAAGIFTGAKSEKEK